MERPPYSFETLRFIMGLATFVYPDPVQYSAFKRAFRLILRGIRKAWYQPLRRVETSEVEMQQGLSDYLRDLPTDMNPKQIKRDIQERTQHFDNMRYILVDKVIDSFLLNTGFYEQLIIQSEIKTRQQSIEEPTKLKHKQVEPPKGKRTTTCEKDEETLTYFRQEVRDGINKALKKNEVPNQKLILKLAKNKTIERKKISIEKLRKDITPPTQVELFGKIYREELAVKEQYINKLK